MALKYKFIANLYSFLLAIIGLPLYLLFNVASGDKYLYCKYKSHFTAKNKLWCKQRKLYYLSNIALLIVIALSFYAVYLYSFVTVLLLYYLPVMLASAFVVMITKCQHTGKAIIWNSNDTISNDGFLQTIDREAGFCNVLNSCWHHICDSHVAHHLNSKIPFYYAIHVTPIVKKNLGTKYKKGELGLFSAFLKYSHHMYRLKLTDNIYKAVKADEVDN